MKLIIKGFKINKIKPLQFKRNLIEKYIDNYTNEYKNKKIKTKRFQKEENKENYFIKKIQFHKKKYPRKTSKKLALLH